MSYGKASLLRKLIPKSYHFDGYNELNVPNTRDKPFFSEATSQIGNYYLTTRIDGAGNLVLEYSSVCPYGVISFKPYILSFERFIELLRTAVKEESDFITFEIQTIYNHMSRYCNGCIDWNKDCSSLLRAKPSTVTAAVSFEITDIKNALSVYFGINKPQSIKGGSIMKGIKGMKSIFGVNFEDFGRCNDPNIKSTLMGVAVRNPSDGNWYIFNSHTQTRTNTAGIKFGDMDVFILPTQTLQVGKLYKIDGKYSFVQAIDNNFVTLLGAADGIEQKKLLDESIIPGLKLYPEVVAFDLTKLTDVNSKEDLSKNIMAAIFLQQCSRGETEFSLENVGKGSFNGLEDCLPVLMMLNPNMFQTADGGISPFQMFMMMGCGNNSDEVNSLMQVTILSQLFNGGTSSPFGTFPGLTPVQPSITSDSSEGEVICPKCGKAYPTGTNFCPTCGEHTELKGKTCTSCGTLLKEGAVFCHICGQKVVKDTCPTCGAKIAPDANFCSGCGTYLKSDTAKVSTKKRPTTKKITTPKRAASTKKAIPEPAVTTKDSEESEE